MKKVGHDTASKQRAVQAKSSLKSDDAKNPSLEQRVAGYLAAVKGSKSLGVFGRELGLPKESLSRYLRAEQSMTLGTLQKIAAALGVSTEEILRFKIPRT